MINLKSKTAQELGKLGIVVLLLASGLLYVLHELDLQKKESKDDEARLISRISALETKLEECYGDRIEDLKQNNKPQYHETSQRTIESTDTLVFPASAGRNDQHRSDRWIPTYCAILSSGKRNDDRRLRGGRWDSRRGGVTADET